MQGIKNAKVRDEVDNLRKDIEVEVRCDFKNKLKSLENQLREARMDKFIYWSEKSEPKQVREPKPRKTLYSKCFSKLIKSFEEIKWDYSWAKDGWEDIK